MAKPLRIYIAGPYTAGTQSEMVRHVNAAIDAGIAAYKKGHFPFIPHLTHFVDQRAEEVGLSLTWEDYIRWDLAWLEECDAILYLGSSRGADLELAQAIRLGKRVFRSTDEVPTVALERRPGGMGQRSPTAVARLRTE